MKRAKFSKVLAFLLAAVMIFSALPLMAFASDEASTYTVSYGAPAIPMNEMTVVNLADISVEMEKGTIVSGADITWAAAEQDGIEFDAAAKTVFAKTAGNYKLTATVGGVTKNVWVLVKEAEQDKFYLVNIPELNKDTFVVNDWRIFGGKNNTNITVAEAIAANQVVLDDNYVQVAQSINGVSNSGGTLVYVNEIFKDFADYTVEGNMASNCANTSGGAGVGGRITLNETEKGYTTGIVSFIRVAKTVAITRLNSAKTLPADFGPHGTATSGAWNNIGKDHLVKTVFNGDNFKFYYDYADGVEPLYEYNMEQGKCTCGHNQCIFKNTIPGAGYPALVGFAGQTRFKSFIVYLNSSELAPATAVNFYTVSNGAPAIPMTENTGVDLNYVNVEMDAEGTVAFGSDIVWDTIETEGIYLNKEANKVSVYEAGTYKLTATANGVTKNVWIVAKKATDDKYYIVNIPELNKDTFVNDDWRVMSSTNNTDLTITEAIDAGYLELADGYVSTAQAFGTTSALKKGGTLVCVDEIFKDFGDYTVEADASSNGAATVEGVGAGVGGRVTLNEAGTGYTTGILSYISQSRVATIYRINNDFGPHGTAIAKDEAGKWYTWTGVENYHTVKTVFSGNVFSFYYGNGEPIYTYNSTPGTCTCSNSNCIFKHTIPSVGYPALVGFGATTHFSSFSVYLNSTDAPNAIAADEKPAEPEATITITGEGTAAVEAVVGSENNYTVELAPAVGYKVKVGSLVINGKAVLGSDSTGRIYTFTTEDLENTTIAVEYIEDNGQFNTVMLGATINEAKKGIRFGSRTDAIKRAASGATTGLLNDKIYVDGATYDITGIGMILVPTKLLDGELAVGGKYVVRQKVSKIVGLTDDFSDIAITLIGIPETQYDIKISSRMYIAYEVDGETKYVYTEVIERSYNDVLAAIGK